MKSDIDVSTLDGIIKAFYEIVSVPKGELRRWDEDKFIHTKDPLILVPLDNAKSFSQLKIDEYHRRRPRLADQSFFEEEIHRVTERFANMAHVWSTYQWHRGTDSGESGRGINSIQLYFSEERWWVSSWFFVSEDKDHPIPGQYLPKPKGFNS